MADIDILSLPVAPSLGGTEDVPIVQGGVNKRTTVGDIADLVLTPTGVSPGTYGDDTKVPTITVDEYGRITNAINTPIEAGQGTVTSVGLALPSDFRVSGSPVTTTGTLTAAWNAVVANVVFAGPASGSDDQPAFRQLVSADLPDPGAGLKGGVQAFSAPSHSFLTGIGTDAVPTAAQPSASDLTNGTTGSGALVLATSPALVSPNLGTPSAINLSNATDLPSTALPDVVTAGTNTKLTYDAKGRITAGTQAAASDLSNGTTGSGAVVLAGSPGLTGAPTAPTQTIGDNSTKLATTAYVQAALSGTTTLPASNYATTTALPTVVYDNGSSGVGATLTAAAVGALSIDGANPTVGQIILVKNQASSLQNGIYSVTVAGSGGVAFILTRVTYYDESGQIDLGDTTFVESGATLASTSWTQNGTENPAVGTDPITWAQTAGPGSFVAGNGIDITGTQIAIDTSVTADLTSTQTLENKTLVAPDLGTPSAINLANATDLPLTTGVTGVLPVANGGTGTNGAVRTITATGSATVGASDAIIAVNLVSSGSVTLMLPAAAARNNAPLSVFDWRGNATITLTPNGSETIMGLASAEIISSGQGAGSAGSAILIPSTALSGWLAI